MKVDVHTTRHYSPDELDTIVQEFIELGFEVSIDTNLIKKSPGAPDIQLVLLFLAATAVGSYFSGFFKEMGADTWDLVKEALFRLFQKKKNEEHPRTMIKFPITDRTYVLCARAQSKNKYIFQYKIRTS